MSKFQTNGPVRIFVVEDDPMYRRMIKYVMELNPDHEVHTFEDAKSCIDRLHLKPTIVTVDYSLPDMNGEELLKRILVYNKQIKVIVLSGQRDVSVAINLLKKGAADYLTKDKETKNLLQNSVALLKENFTLNEEVTSLRNELTEKYQFSNTLLGDSDAMKAVFTLVQRAIENEITVSIAGETGTGKEVVAKSIHYNSSRKKGKFVAVNMSAIPSELLESELFGHEKGAFTGALSRKLGKFEIANKGTLFLDEIGDMDMHLQAKLLRALQEREIVRVGGADPVKFDARIIIATHKDLSEEVSKGNFREDLYYRVLGLPITLPPLRDRGKDILVLAEHFLDFFKKKNTKLRRLRFSADTKKKLLTYAYPGNVRELKALVELSAVMAIDNEIKVRDIQFRSPKQSLDILESEMTMKEYFRKIIHHYLKRYKNVVVVAQKLDIGKSTIYKMLKEDREIADFSDKFNL